ncbi:TRAP transporter substrate-binding protein [Faecalibacterium prausnitzii]|jgi:tripartite ATP-independent transporter DctP family solute receptor|uniref:TRAP transporter substrate-binding protein n=1 Tax=Faecalibacterium prausnitzii TaxID=853 RepID=UPI001FA87517|nr:TRAP transporter substrate-binding protein [Faecalibacterium prausnitzii]MDW2998847.1 TRAP transporter substrate-binding protein [Faecalibacterium prausnitzii]
MIGTRRITRRSFLAAAGLAAVGASLSLTGCSGSVSDGLSSKHLLVAHSHSEAHPVNVGLQKMTEVASAESDLTFSVYPNGQLGDNAAMIQLVKAGVLDIAKVSASSMEQFNSAYAIFSMPYVFESTEQYFAVMNQSEAVQEIFKSTYDQGFFAIGWFDSGSRSIYTTKDGPCEGPADLKGLKIRTQDSPTSIAMIRAMGGSATPMSSGETYTGLQQGIIDGAENNETVLVQDGHGEVCKSYTYTQHQMVPDIVIISTETWESLDETEQSAIINGMTQGNEAHEAVWQDLVQENIDGAKEMGVQFYTIDKTAFIEATQSLRDEFCAKSADNARYYEDFLSYVQA